MGGLFLVPAPLAIPLILVILALLPLIPVAIAVVFIYFAIQAATGKKRVGDAARTACVAAGFCVVIPWGSAVVLWFMIWFHIMLVFGVIFNALAYIYYLSEDVNRGEQKERGKALRMGWDMLWFMTWLPFYLLLFRPLQSLWNLAVQSTNSIRFHIFGNHPISIAEDDGRWRKNPYRYPPLSARQEIRLLEIHPGLTSDTMRGDIITASLLLKPNYDALSYTWADEDGDVDRTCLIHCVESNSALRVTKNCFTALQCLRLPTRKRRVWIDAVCINQDDADERTAQVAMMSQIYVAAGHVIAFTGEGNSETDLLYDWLNGIDPADLVIPSNKLFGNLDMGEESVLRGAADLWNRAVDLANGISKGLERTSRVAQSRVIRLGRFLGPQRSSATIPQEELVKMAGRYFGRRWFKRVWVLQEVALPDARKTRIICGSKVTTGERALHLMSLLKMQGSISMARVFVLLRQSSTPVKTSHLLDILIETRDRECTDPRDKIFGILNIVWWLDGGRFPELKADYGCGTAEVYTKFSAFLIKHHGPGFFLALIKSRPKVEGLPSWAADWAVSWPNHETVRGIDFAGRARTADERDGGAEITCEDGCWVLSLTRPRILKGYFTRDGHVDGAGGTMVESVGDLSRDEVLIEMYPGMAALLEKQGRVFRFVRICPHSVFEDNVQVLVRKWNRIVVFLEGAQEHFWEGRPSKSRQSYLSAPRVIQII